MDTIDPRFWQRQLSIDVESAVPLYHQLKERLRSIASKLRANDSLPTEREICEWTGVSRVTVRRALADLVQESVLVARRGRGTFVAPIRASTPLDRPASFTETMRRLGHTPSSQLVSAEECHAPHLLTVLGREPGESIFRLVRIRYMNGDACMLEQAHLPAALVPDLLSSDLTGSLYSILQSRYDIAPAGGTESIVAIAAPQSIAKNLEIAPGEPVLQTARTTRMQDGTLLEYTIRYARADLCAFTVTLGKGSELGDRSSVGRRVA